jgi:hypothetical protein
MGAVPRLENGWAFGPWGFDSLSFRSGVVERQDARLLIVRRRFESCRRSHFVISSEAGVRGGTAR